jgi:hypothetical protein
VTKNTVVIFSNDYFLGIFATGLIFFKRLEEVSFPEEVLEGITLLRVFDEGSFEIRDIF